jgi:hypothetical protein
MKHDVIRCVLDDGSYLYEVKRDQVLMRLSLPRFIDSLARQHQVVAPREGGFRTVTKKVELICVILMLVSQYGSLFKSEIEQMILGKQFRGLEFCGIKGLGGPGNTKFESQEIRDLVDELTLSYYLAPAQNLNSVVGTKMGEEDEKGRNKRESKAMAKEEQSLKIKGEREGEIVPLLINYDRFLLDDKR